MANGIAIESWEQEMGGLIYTTSSAEFPVWFWKSHI